MVWSVTSRPAARRGRSSSGSTSAAFATTPTNERLALARALRMALERVVEIACASTSR
jgi:hypothetical protein